MTRVANDVGARLVHAGAGRRISARASQAKLATTIRSALVDRSLTANAVRLADAIRGEIAAGRAVAELEALASADQPLVTDPASPLLL